MSDEVFTTGEIEHLLTEGIMKITKSSEAKDTGSPLVENGAQLSPLNSEVSASTAAVQNAPQKMKCKIEDTDDNVYANDTSVDCLSMTDPNLTFISADVEDVSLKKKFQMENSDEDVDANRLTHSDKCLSNVNPTYTHNSLITANACQKMTFQIDVGANGSSDGDDCLSIMDPTSTQDNARGENAPQEEKVEKENTDGDVDENGSSQSGDCSFITSPNFPHNIPGCANSADFEPMVISSENLSLDNPFSQPAAPGNRSGAFLDAPDFLLNKSLDSNGQESHGETSGEKEELFVTQLNQEDLQVPILGPHRGAIVPYSDSEDSDSSSSSSSSYESSDTTTSDSEISENSQEGDVQRKVKTPVKTLKVKGELELDDLPPIEDLHICVSNDQVTEIGKVLHTVDTLVVVESYKDLPPLDIDSVLFLDRGARPMGRIFDVMGPVTQPLYCVRFNSKDHIKEQNIDPGMLVYCAPLTEHSSFVFLQHLLMMKGSDASWKKDKEMPVTLQDFSDDEEEVQKCKEENSKKSSKQKNSAEPQAKAAKIDQYQTFPSSKPNKTGYQGCRRGSFSNNYVPRNPWNWGGSRHSNASNPGLLPPPKQPGKLLPRGPIRPPLFNIHPHRFPHPTAPSRNSSENHSSYPRHSQFGRVSDPRMFGHHPHSMFSNTPPPCEYATQAARLPFGRNSSGCGNPFTSTSSYGTLQQQTYSNQCAYEGYSHSDPSTSMASPNSFEGHLSAPSMEDQRYHAFQSEIARLVDAYNMGASSPTAVASPPRLIAPHGFRPQSNRPLNASSFGMRSTAPPRPKRNDHFSNM